MEGTASFVGSNAWIPCRYMKEPVIYFTSAWEPACVYRLLQNSTTLPRDLAAESSSPAETRLLQPHGPRTNQ